MQSDLCPLARDETAITLDRFGSYFALAALLYKPQEAYKGIAKAI
jgi:hypothetical protein